MGSPCGCGVTCMRDGSGGVLVLAYYRGEQSAQFRHNVSVGTIGTQAARVPPLLTVEQTRITMGQHMLGTKVHLLVTGWMRALLVTSPLKAVKKSV